MTAPASPPLTPAEIAELRRLHEEATPAPWSHGYGDGSGKVGSQRDCGGVIVAADPAHDGYLMLPVVDASWRCGGGVARKKDADLIPAARNALGRLLLAAERAEEMARALEQIATTPDVTEGSTAETYRASLREIARAALAAHRGSR